MFPSKRKCKLQERGDGPFKVLECKNDNKYKIDLPLQYGVNNTFNVIDLTLCDVGTFDINLRVNSSQQVCNDKGLSKEEEFGFGGFNMDGPRSKRFQEELGGRLNFLMEKGEEEAKLINFSQLLEYDLFSFLIVFWAYFQTCNEFP